MNLAILTDESKTLAMLLVLILTPYSSILIAPLTMLKILTMLLVLVLSISGPYNQYQSADTSTLVACIS